MCANRLILLCLLAPTFVVAQTVPTEEPTPYPAKTEEEIQMLKECAASRASTDNNVYVQPDPTTRLQKVRSGGRTGYDFQAKLDAFDFDLAGIMKGEVDTEDNRAFVQGYAWSLVYITVPSFIVLLAAIIFVVPCWCGKTIGEITACMCGGKGCCGFCNDYFCGMHCCPSFGIFDGACRYGPIADYGTLGCVAHYERDPHLENMDPEDMSCVQKCGKKVELDDDEEYHARDDYFGQRKKPMESRCAVPNFVWLIVLGVATGGLYFCGIGGQVYATKIINGVTDVIDEGNCAVADAIDFCESISTPITNISTTANVVIENSAATIASASTLDTQLTNIANLMTAFANTLRTDSCGFGDIGVSWPTTLVEDLATTVDNSAATVSSQANGPVADLDATLQSISSILESANASLAMATKQAKDVTDGEVMDLLRDTVQPINAQISKYTGYVKQYQAVGVRVLFILIWALATLTIVVSIVWLVATELYECEQKKNMSKRGTNEAEGEDDDEEEKGHCCKDALCATFQISHVWFMHAFHFGGWVMLVLVMVLALIFNPASIIVSDVCVTADHFATNPAQWLNIDGSPFQNNSMVIGVVESCLDVNGNVLDALGVADQLTSFGNVSFGDATNLDLSSIDFSSVDTMVNEVNALTTSSLYDFSQGADDAVQALNNALSQNGGGVVTVPMCYGQDANNNCNGVDGLDDTNCQCVRSRTEADVVTFRTLSLKIYPTEVCSGTYLSDLKASALEIQTEVAKLSTDMAALKASIVEAESAMGPINNQIDILYDAGSCAFVRRRLNGILKGACGDTLDGMSGEGYWCLFLGLSLWVYLFVVHNFVISRFRMYDVACWHHDRTNGCCGPKYDEDEDDHIEMVNKYSGTRSRVV